MEPNQPVTAESLAEAVQAGVLSQSEFDAKIKALHTPGSGAPGATDANTPAPNDNAPAALLEIGLNARDSQLAIQSMQDALAKKIITQEAYDAQFKEWGIEPPAVDTRTPEQIALDNAYGQTARPEEYTLPRMSNPDLTEQDQHAASLTIRSWLSAGGFERTLGSNMAAAADRAAERWGKLSPSQKYAETARVTENLKSVFKEQYQEKIKAANTLVSEIDKKSPGLVKFLEITGIGSDPQVILYFVRQAEINAARSAKK